MPCSIFHFIQLPSKFKFNIATRLEMYYTGENSNQMKSHSSLTRMILPIIILITSHHCHANQSQPISQILSFDQFPNTTHQWWTLQTQFHEAQIKLTPSIVVGGVLCFIAASISSAGGVGGGGLFIPILTVVAGLDLKTASSFSAFMVTGGSIANVLCNMFRTSKKIGNKTLIDYDIALLSEPCMLLGVSIGVICNLVFPEWLITVLFAVFLVWSTFKTCKAGVLYWRLESEEERENGCGDFENGLVRDEICDGSEGLKSTKEPLLGGEQKCKLGIPWMKLGVLVIVWFSFFGLYLLRGNRYGQSTILNKACGLGYWILSAVQIPFAVIFTAWMLYRIESLQDQTSNQQEKGDQTTVRPSNKLVFPIMALLAGILGGVFGIGGGMLISPLLLQVGIAPEVTAATCSFMVFFSSTMSAIQYLLLGMEHTDVAIIFALICFVASLVGLMVVQTAIGKHGRASLIVFSVGTVMALSTVLITSFGALDVWKDYTSGKYMGFKQPC